LIRCSRWRTDPSESSIEPKPKTRGVHRTSNTIAHEQNSPTFHKNIFFPSHLLIQADDYYPHQHPFFYFIRDMFTNELQEQEENRYTIYIDKSATNYKYWCATVQQIHDDQH
jgi:hypothetical protein